jgi:glycerol-3-phosphate dehydrogenase (NAD(P)+)
MARVTVLGAGVMGTAMTIPLADNGHNVRLVGTHLDDEIIEEVRTSQRHPRLRTPVPDTVQPYHLSNLEEALEEVDLLILGVNSQGIRWAVDILGPVISKNTPILMIAKGLVGDDHHLHILPEVLRQGLAESIRRNIQIAAVGGPSIAGELADRRHTSIVIAGSEGEHLEKYAEILRTPYYHVWTSTDAIGVEVSVAMKNIYAVGVGFVYGRLEKKGMDNIHNPAAAVFAQGLHETAYLVDYLGGDLTSVYTLPGAGDGFVTCQGGRNVQIGRRMGKGMTYREAIAIYKPNERPEGPPLAIAIGETIRSMIQSGKLNGDKLPLLCSLIDVFIDGETFETPWDSFFC